MAHKKPFNVKTPEQFTIFVETLAGTTFAVKVSPQDNVGSIKSKIQKVEGVPVPHQHLLYKLKELNDSSCITEPSVALHDGATIKLVLSMRGGPISLVHQAVPLNRAVLRNLLQINREDLEQDLPPGCKMAIVVLRVGDQLNLLHVVEDTEPPVDLLDDERPISLEDNSKTMEKVCDLKDRMEKLSLQRKKLVFKRGDKSLRTSSTCAVNLKKVNNTIKLPSINNDSRRDMFKSRSDFSQIPILPDIVPQFFKNSSRDLEFAQWDEESPSEVQDTFRPKTCPVSSLSENHFYDVFNGDGYTKSLQVMPTQHRSCISASNPKLHQEWDGDQKDVIPSLDILPPISNVSNLLNSHRNTSRHNQKMLDPTTNSETTLKTAVKFKQHVKNMSDCGNHDNKRETSESVKYLERTDDTGIWSTSTSSYYKSTNTCRPEVFIRLSSASRSQLSTKDTPFSDLLKNKTKANLVQHETNKNLMIERKTRPRCSECNKKLSLTNTFECRCGFAFCTFHRYSETHNCTYDFKKDNRRILEQANPSVVAPKLPKI